jgi:hypothetical protein
MPPAALPGASRRRATPAHLVGWAVPSVFFTTPIKGSLRLAKKIGNQLDSVEPIFLATLDGFNL